VISQEVYGCGVLKALYKEANLVLFNGELISLSLKGYEEMSQYSSEITV